MQRKPLLFNRIYPCDKVDLRRRLDQREADHWQALDRLAVAQKRIAALLTDQRATTPAPARRSWWRWRSK
jgi:hypothetical protein